MHALDDANGELTCITIIIIIIIIMTVRLMYEWIQLPNTYSVQQQQQKK